MTSLLRTTVLAATTALTLAAAVSMADAHNFGRGGFNQNKPSASSEPAPYLGLFGSELSRAFGLEDGCAPNHGYGEDCG